MVSARRFKQILLGGSVFALLLIAGLQTSLVGAQASQANAANGLQVSPAIAELNGEAGNTYKIDIKATNVTASDLVFSTDVNDFTAGKDETGTPSIDLENSNPSTASLRQWVTVLTSFSLKARETKTISVTVSIADNAEPGGHYGVVRFSGRAPDVESGVGLAASTGTLLLVRVAGAVDEDLNLVTFQTSQNDNPSGIFEYGPIDFIARFENKGNIHLKPVGQIEVRDMFGNKVETLSMNADKGNVLPLSIRKFQSTLEREWMFGRYTADISVAYGTTGQAIVKSISFWVIPYKVILGAILALVTLIFVFRTLIKRYNNYIIKRANQHHGTKTKKHKK
jgi:hypothetical protein